MNTSPGHTVLRELLLNARAVQPFVWLTNVSNTPIDPSKHCAFALMNDPHPTGTVPAGHVAVTVVRHVPFAVGVQLGSCALMLMTVFPGPGGPCAPAGPAGPVGPCGP